MVSLAQQSYEVVEDDCQHDEPEQQLAQQHDIDIPQAQRQPEVVESEVVVLDAGEVEV